MESTTLRRSGSFGGFLLVVLFLSCGAALAATGYPDRLRDVESGAGPDLASVAVSDTKTRVTFRIRFAAAPPLRVSAKEGWIDMLLIGIDVPPLGPVPVVPGGEWRGANFALGTHGPSQAGVMVRQGMGEFRMVRRFPIVTRGSTLTLSIPRTALGNPAWFTFTVAAARETNEGSAGGGVDIAPERGTFRYSLSG
jgi:hypothetical protein